MKRDEEFQKIIDREMVVQQWEKKVEETKEAYSHAKKGFDTAVGELRKAIEAARTGQGSLGLDDTAEGGKDQAA